MSIVKILLTSNHDAGIDCQAPVRISLVWSKPGARIGKHLHGRLSIGAAPAIIVIPPLTKPEEPRPAMVLPAMNMPDVWAAPHNREPTSKMKTMTRKTHCANGN